MAQPASGKPSLTDNTPPSGGPGIENGESIRMLDALGPGTRAAQGTAARRGFGWVLAGLMLLVACGVSWSWWNQRSHADDSADRVARVSAAPTALPVKPAPAPASAASATAEPAPGATIVAMPEPVAPAAAPSAAVVAAASAPAKTKPTATASARDTRLAANSNLDRKRAAQPSSTANRKATAAPNNDPDVALLSAMLATMSRDANPASNGSPSAQTQLTIAQLVQRCDMRGVKDAIETFECKRRICDGYWGKAEACPMSLSPKKN